MVRISIVSPLIGESNETEKLPIENVGFLAQIHLSTTDRLAAKGVWTL